MRVLWVIIALTLLGGCYKSSEAVIAGLKASISSPDPSTNPDNLKPNLRYLRVTSGKNVALLALGYLDESPFGTIEVWYSADFEVLKLLNGRLVGLSGTPVEWTDVQLLDVPDWKEVHTDSGFVRIRDTMPGYIFKKKDSVILVSSNAPRNNRLLGIPDMAVRWFKESVLAQKSDLVAYYAVSGIGDDAQIIYGQQCLSADFCLSWQPWDLENIGRL